MVKDRQFDFSIVCFYEILLTERTSVFNGLPDDIKLDTKGREVVSSGFPYDHILHTNVLRSSQRHLFVSTAFREYSSVSDIICFINTIGLIVTNFCEYLLK